jgi:hypothetical protein
VPGSGATPGGRYRWLSVLSTLVLGLCSPQIGAKGVLAVDRLGAIRYTTCQPEELKMTIGEEFAASGSGADVVTLAARSQPRPPCTLDGYPQVVLLDRAGAVVVTFRAGHSAGTLPPLAHPRPVMVDGNNRAQFIFEAADYRSSANSGRGAACPTSTALRVTLPGGGQLLAHGKFQLCLSGGVGAFIAAPALAKGSR